MPVTNYHSVEGELLGETTAGARTDYVPDALGSVVATAGGLGTLTSSTAFRPYGSRLSGSPVSYGFVGSLGYRGTGRRFASHYARARHYDEATGSWTSVDPLWPVESAYLYVEDNPVSWADPSGMRAVSVAPPRPITFPRPVPISRPIPTTGRPPLPGSGGGGGGWGGSPLLDPGRVPGGGLGASIIIGEGIRAGCELYRYINSGGRTRESTQGLGIGLARTSSRVRIMKA